MYSPTHPLNIYKVSLCHCILTHTQTVMMSKYFMNTHPPIKHIQGVTLSLQTNPPTNSYDVKIFHFITHSHPLNIYKVSLSLYTHPLTNSYDVKIFDFINTHPPTHETYLKCHSVTIYSPTNEQLQCQNNSFYEHPPTHRTYTRCHSVTLSDGFILPTYGPPHCS